MSIEEIRTRFLPYNPPQDYLLPPSVDDVLGPQHLCFFLHRVVERLDVSAFREDYQEEGRPAYAPALLLKVWLYAYTLGITSCRRLEQRAREELGLRYLAGGAQPDFWTLNAFRRRAVVGLGLRFARSGPLRAPQGFAPAKANDLTQLGQKLKKEEQEDTK
jgi:transposase